MKADQDFSSDSLTGILVHTRASVSMPMSAAPWRQGDLLRIKIVASKEKYDEKIHIVQSKLRPWINVMDSDEDIKKKNDDIRKELDVCILELQDILSSGFLN